MVVIKKDIAANVADIDGFPVVSLIQNLDTFLIFSGGATGSLRVVSSAMLKSSKD
jgi:hypothetical protein